MLTVAAIGPDEKPTSFSNASAAIDLSAPGIGILTGVPAGFDPDGTADGFAPVSGTSFSAPMVSAAVAWIRAARPDLTPYQAAQVVRRGARDIGARGYENSTGFGALSLPGALAKRRRRTIRWSPTTTSATSTAAPSGRSRRRSSTAGSRRRSPPRPTWPRTRSTSTA